MSVTVPSRISCSDCEVSVVVAGLGVAVQPLWIEESHGKEKGVGRRYALQLG